MTTAIDHHVYRFYIDLGRELQRARLARRLSLEQVCEALRFKNTRTLKRVEKGQYFPIYFYLRIVRAYKMRIIVRLENER